MKNLIIYASIFLLGFSLSANSVKQLGVQEGLSGRQAFVVKQDNKGFIWIATRFGVDRYDGGKIKKYEIPILTSQYPVRSINLESDNNESIWAYTDGGLIYKYDEGVDNFILYKKLHLPLKTITFDKNNNIWFGAKNTFGVIKNDEVMTFNVSQLISKNVKKIIHYKDSKKIILANYGVFIFDAKTEKLYPLFSDNNYYHIKDLLLETAYYDSIKDELWIGTVSKGPIIYSLKDKKVISIKNLHEALNPIMCITPVNDSIIFIGTDGTGAWAINKNKYEFICSYKQSNSSSISLSGDGVYDIFKDRNSYIWLSTYSGGVNILNLNEGVFNLINYGNNKQQLSSPQNIITGLLEDSNGNMWIGSHDGLLFRSKNQQNSKYYLTSIPVFTLLEDSDGNIWVGTYGHGVYLLNKNGGIINHYKNTSGKENCLGTNFVYSIFEDSQKNIWLGGKKGILSRYSKQEKRFIQYPISLINNITSRDDRYVLIGTEAGIFEISAISGNYRELPINKTIKSLYINDIYVQSDSVMWLASYGAGVIRCNYRTNELKYFNKSNGFLSDIIYSLLPDNNNNIWLSTEDGMSQINTTTYDIENFNDQIELPSVNYRQLSRMKARDGKMFFGSYNGLVTFYPEKMKSVKIDSKLVFLDFKLFNRSTKPNEENSPLTDAIDNTSHVRLKYNEHSFSLDFTSIDFSGRSKKQYMWKLEELDSEWVGPSFDNTANYTNLSPGHYTFKLRAIDNNSNILDEREIRITIDPPFWKTSWAITIECIFALIIAYLIYRYIRYVYEKKHTQEKIKFFINTAHDLRSPLTLMSAPLFELREKCKQDTWNDYLLDMAINNLSKLNKMVSQLLDFQKVYEDKDKIVLQETDLNRYIKDKVEFWQPTALTKEISLTSSVPDELIKKWIDMDKMDKILDNLISNALKYTLSKGKVSINLSSKEKYWQIIVSDNGIGIPKSAQNNLFRRFYRAENAINSNELGSGLGLLLIKNYVNILGGIIKLESAENEGSDFIVRFRHDTSYLKNAVRLNSSDYPIQVEPHEAEKITNYENIKIKILIVEDNKDLREYMGLSLSHYYKTYECANGQEAWDTIPSINPDIIISDLNMPIMDGLELCQKVKSTFEYSHIPMILLTIANNEKNLADGLKRGADDFIPKPFDMNFLRIKIDNIINNRKLLRMKFLGINKADDQGYVYEDEFNNEFVRKTTRIIEEHMMDSDFSIANLSKEMGLSRTLLFSKFNSITGYTPNDFIKVTRMKKAIELFYEKKYLISEVANMTGFVDPSYFATCFKKIYGKSPKQFIEEDIK